MKKQLLSGLAFLVASAAVVASPGEEEPLLKANRYTLEMDEHHQATPDFFPIGILGGAWDLLPFMGMNLSEAGHCCYDFPTGRPCGHKQLAPWVGRGKFFMSIWAAHTVYNSRVTKNHGTLKNRINGDGSVASNHDLNYADPVTRRYVLDCAAATARQNVERDSANIGIWGIDNEYELGPDYSPESIALFRAWLPKAYDGDLTKFQQAWGTQYHAFGDAVPPKIEEREQRPGAWLDWRRFSEEFFAQFLCDYFAAIQNADPLKRPVVAKNTQCTLEMQAVARRRAINHELIAAKTRELSQGWYGFDQYGHGDRNNYEMNYFYNCIRPMDAAPGKRYGGFAGENNNHAGPGWQFAQTFYRELANGLRGGEFFCMGGNGATGDWATFSFIYPDGTLRDRFFYASRFASMVHRTEKLWSRGVPAAGLPKIAMLLPQRDILLAKDTGVSWWDYSTNNRLNVFSRLRDAGYWVDVLPYGKLTREQLKNYGALVLVNAEHLTAAECATIDQYVKDGGVLLADMMAGKYDEHHIEHNGLEKLLGVTFKGVYTGIEVSPDDLWYNTPHGNLIRGDGKILAELTTAKLVNSEDVFRNAKGAWITENKTGKGKAYWFNTRLGALRPESSGNQVVAQWFGARLRDAGLAPAYCSDIADQGKLRVEQPISDPEGNCVIAVAGTTFEPIPASKLTLTLPKGKEYTSAWWGSAESTWLSPLEFSLNDDGSVTFKLPEIHSAGMIYLLPSYAPMVGLKVAGAGASAENDPYTAQFKPGDDFSVTVQIVNPMVESLPEGSIRLQTLTDWQVSEAQAVKPLAPGKFREYTFHVKIPAESPMFRPNFAYPLVVTLENNGKRTAVANAIVILKLDTREYDHLLTGNIDWGNKTYPFTLRTSAEYIYELPKGGSVRDPGDAKSDGKQGNALTSGLDWWNNVAKIASPEAAIVFDLKKEFAVTKVELRYHGGEIPSGLEVFAGADGKIYKKIGEMGKAVWNDRWTELAFPKTPARFIKLIVKFPKKDGGWLDEVAIWGRTL